MSPVVAAALDRISRAVLAALVAAERNDLAARGQGQPPAAAAGEGR